jgi:hypothetical protein
LYGKWNADEADLLRKGADLHGFFTGMLTISLVNKNFFLKTIALPLMGAASFCVRLGGHKRYSGQQESAPENTHVLII